MIVRDIYILTIQGDTEQVFIGSSRGDAVKVATEWLLAEEVKGYLGSDVSQPRNIDFQDHGVFWYEYTTTDGEQAESCDNYSIKQQTLVWDR